MLKDVKTMLKQLLNVINIHSDSQYVQSKFVIIVYRMPGWLVMVAERGGWWWCEVGWAVMRWVGVGGVRSFPYRDVITVGRHVAVRLLHKV